MCTVYRKLSTTSPIAMKLGDSFIQVQSGYKLYEGKYDTDPIYAEDGASFSILVGDGGSMFFVSLATLAASTLLTLL